MFYSQFILAKKGPLGTIWIAAHLERKLRKNQVADTDIGVSVDSILFPDVPIALRLSSHLLLGVVRIYSKKVNYLFHDCSEALVKIKQAFRSTAVDLPPEESTAPYHSITLPETFDLENFELPDSAFLDSNFVDHHVSTREQITLQDTVNGTAFPTSKFGLDERFGDGDASQIGLELDEELFMDKNISQQHDAFSMDSKVSGVHHGETSVPSSSMGIDVQFGYDEEKGPKVPNQLSELLSNNYDRNCFSSVEGLRRDVDSSRRHGYNIQTPDLNEVFLPDCDTVLSPLTPHIPFTPEAQTPCLMEPAQAPSTPGLLEEVIPSNFQEVPALSPQEKAGAYVESGRSGLCSSPYMEVECTETGNKSDLTSAALGHKSGETAEELHPFTSALGHKSGETAEELHPFTSALGHKSGETAEELHPFTSALGHKSGETAEELHPFTSALGHKSGETAEELHPFTSALGHKSGETAEELPPFTSDLIGPMSESLPPTNSNVNPPPTNLVCPFTSDLIGPMSESLPPTNSNMNLTKTDIVCLISGAENQQSGLTGEAENTAGHRHGNEEAIFPSGYSHETATMTSTPKPAACFETDPVTSNICTDNLDLLGVISDVDGVPLKDNSEPSDIGNLGHVEVGGSCITLNTSTVGADFVLRSCGSNLHPPSSHIVDGALGETSELFPGDHCYNFRTPVGEDVLHTCESSFEVQGEDSRYTNGRVINLDWQQTSVCTPSVVKSFAAKQDELSTVVFSNVFQLDHVNYSSSSEFLGPDKMLGPACDVDLPNHGLQITCKGVTESDGSVDRTSSHCSRKRRIMDSSATMQTGCSAKLSGIPRSRRIADYIPDDDDVLASILVGRKAPPLRMGPTPCLSKASSQKRPRTISRLGMPKRRKVLVDQAMVLQADAIRQQLINTEDIRRMRKKAPCTRPEIWRIYIGAMEDEIFYHSTLTGKPLQLNVLNDQYVLQRDPHVKTSGEAVSSRVSEFVNDTGDKEMDGSILSVPGIIVKMGGPSRISASDTMQSHDGGAQFVSRVSKFVNDTGDKEMDGSILSVPSIVVKMGGPSRISALDTMQSHEGGAQCTSSVSEFVNDTVDKEMDGSILSVPDTIVKMGGPSRISASDTMQSHEGAAQCASKVSEFVNDTGDNEMDGSILSVPGIIVKMGGPSRISASDVLQSHEGGAQCASRVSEFVNDTGDKEIDGNILSVPDIIVKMGGPSRISVSDTMQSHEGGAQCASRVSEFLNDTGDKEMDGSILSVPGIIVKMGGPSRISASDTLQSHEGGAQCASRVSEFVNDTGDKEMDGSILSVPGIIVKMGGPSRISASDTLQSHEGGAQCASRVSEFVNDTGDKEIDGSILSVPGIIVKMGGPSRISASDTMQSHEGGAQCDVHDQLKEVPVRPQEGLLSNGLVAVISSMEVDAVAGANSIIHETIVPEIDKSASFLEKSDYKSINLAERPAYTEALNPLNTPNDGSDFSECATTVGINGDTSFLVKPDDKSINLAERSAYTEAQNPLNTPNDGSDFAECATTVGFNDDTAFATVISETFIQAENVCSAVGAAINEEEKIMNAVKAKNSESHYTGLASDVGTNEVVVTDESAFVVQGDEAPEQDLGDEKRPITDVACGELPNIVSFESSIEHAPSTMGENSCIHEINLEGGLDMDNIPVNIGIARDSSDFCSAINDNYTGFLNVDDEAELNEEENEAPNREAQSLENSGWSARTRGVARYLKILFDEESGRGRKTVAVDRLLAGKTRKEASRMFFETLVLKTRDYIQVQQEKPFEYINIKPRSKLLASEF